jgi:hypothetical protein
VVILAEQRAVERYYRHTQATDLDDLQEPQVV